MPSHNKHEPQINITGLTVKYDDRAVFSNLSLTIPKGSITAILGPNGSGKSTLMKAILGLIPFQKGKIEIHGHPIKERYGKIGYVPQRFDVDPNFPITVFEFLKLAMPNKVHADRLKESLGEVGLNPITIKNMPLSSLSGGQLQRVLIARAIIGDPDILFLDEPSTGIDIVGEQSVFALLEHLNKEHKTTIVMISHEVGYIEKHVSNVICLNRGLVCSGPPAKALSETTMKKMFGEHHERIDHKH